MQPKEARPRRRRRYNPERKKQSRLAWIKKIPSYATEDVVGKKLDQLTLEEGPVFPKLQQLRDRFWDAENKRKTQLFFITCLWLLALLVKVLTGGSITSLTLLGMSFSWLAQAFLLEYQPIRKWVHQYYLWGLGFLILSTWSYIGAAVLLYEGTETHTVWLFWLCFIIFTILTLLLTVQYVLRSHRQPLLLRFGFLVSCFSYGMLATLGVTLSIATAGQGFLLMLGTVGLYLFGVLQAATHAGGVKFRGAKSGIWIAYVLGQIFLLAGAGMLSGGN